MKKIAFLSIALTLAASATAGGSWFTYIDTEGYPVYGSLRRVSPNGIWAVGSDDYFETGCFVINTSQPEDILLSPDGMLLDVDNEGLAVGAWYDRQGGGANYKHAAVYKDGVWTRLPEPEESLGQSYAIAISADSKMIAGHAMCANVNPDEPGRYFPVVWKLDAAGEWKLDRLYNDISVPGTMGFFVYDMTPNGRYICGLQMLDFSDTIPALLDTQTGEKKEFYNIEYKKFTFTTVVNGKEMEFESDGMYIDGMLDGFDETTRFSGLFDYATDRYLFGSHDIVSNVGEDGSATLTHYATAYDLETGQFIDGPKNQMYLCGNDPYEAFTNRATLYTNLGIPGNPPMSVSINDYLDDKKADVAGIYSFNNEGNVWGGSYIYTDNVSGDMLESPVLILLDDPGLFNSIANVSIDPCDASVSVNGREIVVSGDAEAAVYTASGLLLSRNAATTVTPGAYIVKAGNAVSKVIVK